MVGGCGSLPGGVTISNTQLACTVSLTTVTSPAQHGQQRHQ
uniref:Bm386 n=1 Tax=Brugia malayi TaxID=6279 RepID=A0A1I9G196_BRUMA|nr:Bm386 [Brugia malayi]